MRVFLSSTYVDLVEYRKQAVEALARLGHESVYMEIFGARPAEPLIACADEIEACDIFVGIYAHRYGFIPPSYHQSIVEAEYEVARRANKKTFCFVVDEEYPWPPKMVDGEPARSRLAQFKARIGLSHVRETFTTPGDLALKVATSVGRYLSGHLTHDAVGVDQVAAVCYRRTGGQLEFLLILTDGRRRLFPKGGVHAGETPWAAAEREAAEEAGVTGRVAETCLKVFTHLKRGKKRQGRELRVGAYLLEVCAMTEPEEDSRDPAWFSPDAAEQVLAEGRTFKYARELRDLVREACRVLEA